MVQKLVFRAFSFTPPNTTDGGEPWITDGTTAGTVLLKDVLAGASGSNPQYFFSIGSKVVFYASDPVNGSELWATDGTAAGTTLLADINPGFGSAGVNNLNFTKLGNKMLFTATNPTTGIELWVTDGTSAGTQLLSDIVPGSGNGAIQFKPLTILGNSAIFGADGDIWSTDGTPAGTVKIFDFVNNSAFRSSAASDSLFKAGGLVYFSASTVPDIGQPTNELWVTDGSTAGTRKIANLGPNSQTDFATPIGTIGNSAIFVAQIGAPGVTPIGTELYISNGTSFDLLKDIVPGLGSGNINADPAKVLTVGNKLFFTREVPGAGNPTELWVTDGTTGGTQFVQSFVNITSPKMTAFGNSVVFTATTNINGVQNSFAPWISDGTAAGTKQLVASNVTANGTNSEAANYIEFGGKLFFVANGGLTIGKELWVSDGTPAGTTLLKDIYPGAFASAPSDFVVLGNKLLFQATSASGREYWVSDGTSQGTVLLKDIATGSIDSVLPTGPFGSAILEGPALQAPTYSIAGTPTAAEGGALSFTVTRDIGTADGTIAFSLTGTATSGADYTTPAQTVSFLAGETSKTVTITTLTDALDEPNETVTLTLGTITGGGTVSATNGVATGTITNVTPVPVDTTPPTVTINQAAAQVDPTTGTSIVFDVAFSEAVTGFTTGDVVLGGTAGATSAVVTGSGANYTVTVSGMTQAGTVTVAVPQGAAIDGANNANTASTSTDNTVTYTPPVPVDTTPPTVTINQAAAQVDPTSGTSIVFDVAFSEAVTGFTTGDVVLGGTAGATSAVVTGSGANYTVTVSGMTQAGTVTVAVPQGAAIDGANNANTASTSTDNTVTYTPPVPVDTTPPTVTINQAAAQVDPTSGTSIVFDVAFSEAVTGFTTGDVVLGGTAGATSAVVTGSGANYTVTVSGMTQAGTVTVAVPQGAAIDGANNANTASTSTDNTVTYTPPPTYAITGTPTATEGGTLSFTVTRDNGTADGTVAFSLSGTATSGADYTAPAQTVSFLAGETSKTVTITTLTDAVAEPNETVTLTLGAITGGGTVSGSNGTATGTITDSGISLTQIGVAYTQNFDTLALFGSSGALPFGWSLKETGANANGLYTAGTGQSSAGDTYSFGAAASIDRALGSIQSGTLSSVFGASFVNNTSATISALDITFRGEQWRLGTANRLDSLKFEVSVDATAIDNGSWQSVAALDFNTLDSFGPAGARDGNSAANGTFITSTIGALNIAAGSTFFIRWTDTDATGADDGLAVDDFSLTPRTAPAVPAGTVSINDVTITEGNAGTQLATFTLTRTGGTAAFDVTVATANGTATAGSDYAAVAPTIVSFAAGELTKTIFVSINGDLISEPDETFFVNLSAATNGATIGDGQGVGTISNDDTTAVQIVNLTNGPDTFQQASATTAFVVNGLAGPDVITTGLGDDTITGGLGNDILSANGGNDVFLVGANAGRDAFDGGAGTDTILATAANIQIGIVALSGVEAISANGFANVSIIGSNADNLLDFSSTLLTGIGLIDGAGGNDTIIGSAGDDTIAGGFGRDLIQAGGGNDVIQFGGNSNDDRFDGGSGTDRLVATGDNASLRWTNVTGVESVDGNGFAGVRLVGTGAGDTLDLSATTLKDIAFIDAGAGADTVLGSGGNDVILGGFGSDTLNGNGGNDRIIGGAKADLLTGGEGGDTFVFAAGFGRDTITDFNALVDRLEFSGGLFANDQAAFDAATDVGANVVVTLDASNTVTLLNLQKSALTIADFHVV